MRAVAAVRRGLDQDVRGTTRAVTIGLGAGRPLQPLARITHRLARSAAELDADLAVIAAEPDPTRRRALLDEQHERVDALHRACEQVRNGVLLAGDATNGAQLPLVVGDLTDEVVRLRMWAQAHHELRGS